MSLSISGAGVVVARWRKRKGLKLKTAAGLLGCTSAFVSAVEHDIRPVPVSWLTVLPEEDVLKILDQWLLSLPTPIATLLGLCLKRKGL